MIVGKENLELEGPIIYVSNHPNSFLDPLLLATNQRPRLHYIAGAEWFGKGFKNYVFRDHFNMIPVVRPWLKSGEKVSNDEMFEQCYYALEKGKRIVIYPEGTSVTVSKIRELKTGVTRIKMGGDAYLKRVNAKWQDVKIVPVGLNYYNPRKFQSDVIMHLGDPIDFSDIEVADEKEQVRLMTERIREKMSELVFHFDQEDFTQLSKDVYKIYGGHLRKQMNLSKSNTSQVYLLQKRILESAQYFHENHPEKLIETRSKIEDFMEQLTKHRLDMRYMGGYRWPSILFVRLLLGSPFFIIGWLLNIIPFQLTRWAFEKFMRPKFATTYEAGKLNPSFLASMVFIMGIVVFLLWYVILTVVFMVTTGIWWLVPGLILFGYGFGIYAARYARMFFDFVRILRVINRRRKHPEVYQSIQKQWQSLVSELDGLRAEFDIAAAAKPR